MIEQTREAPIPTSEVVRAVGVKLAWINNRIRHGDLDPPPKVGQMYAWWPEDVARVRELWAGWGRK